MDIKGKVSPSRLSTFSYEKVALEVLVYIFVCTCNSVIIFSGIGSILYREILDRTARNGFKTAIAGDLYFLTQFATFNIFTFT